MICIPVGSSIVFVAANAVYCPLVIFLLEVCDDGRELFRVRARDGTSCLESNPEDFVLLADPDPTDFESIRVMLVVAAIGDKEVDRNESDLIVTFFTSKESQLGKDISAVRILLLSAELESDRSVLVVMGTTVTFKEDELGPTRSGADEKLTCAFS